MATTDLSRTQTAPENRSRRPSRASLRRARSSPEDDSHQLFSPQFMDDHGAHHYHVSATRDAHIDDDNDTDMEAPESPLSDDTLSGSTAEESHEEEVRFGVVNSRDLEAGPTRPDLKTEKSARSIKDPNLVSSPLCIPLYTRTRLNLTLDR